MSCRRVLICLPLTRILRSAWSWVVELCRGLLSLITLLASQRSLHQLLQSSLVHCHTVLNHCDEQVVNEACTCVQSVVVGVSFRLTRYGSRASRVRMNRCQHQRHSHSYQLFSANYAWQCSVFCHVPAMQNSHDMIRCRFPYVHVSHQGIHGICVMSRIVR